jgi:hypothetical protein
VGSIKQIIIILDKDFNLLNKYLKTSLKINNNRIFYNNNSKAMFLEINNNSNSSSNNKILL